MSAEFIEAPRPPAVCTDEAVAVRTAANEELAAVLYGGSVERRAL